jgi:excinuclease ABC subunit A
VREEIYRKYISLHPCPDCQGARLRPESLAVIIAGKSIAQITQVSIKEAFNFFSALTLTRQEMLIAHQILKEIRERLKFLINVGLDYVTLDRKSATLSGGEAERIRLATQIGSSLVGVLYILDEPTIGLHQRDNRRLRNTLYNLRDLGNTVLVVEHDEATIRAADYIIDLGPGAGEHGGKVVASGPLEKILECEESLTGKYLRGELQIKVPEERKVPKREFLEIRGVRHNNLKNLNIKIPLGLFVCITGVSGSGKSSLIDETLFRALAQHFYGSRVKPGDYDEIRGLKYIDKVIEITQDPIGRTPRSNPATYTGTFTPIRELFAEIPESKMRGYKLGRFSFNVKGGRCEACKGDGIIKIEMHFLPDVYIPCEVCKGARFNRETLEIRYKGKNIAEVLNMTVEESLEFFKNIPRIKRKLQTINDVGLGYIKLGQSATTLSGGEAQRVKLSTELSKVATGRTLYILDEPTTGLHFADIQKLLDVLRRLTETGNTVVVIEHNLDVIKAADYIIDLGPEGGDEGGEIVAEGTPEELAGVKDSYTGQFLKNILPGSRRL